jgi:ubiquinone/menaquinone biosynthesis C-methylase UbiE
MEPTKNNLLDIDYLLDKIKLEKGDYSADLGCGIFGYFTFKMARVVGESGKVYAVDILKDNLEAIKKKARTDNLDQIETVWTDLEILNATKIKSSSLDSALLINVLHQSEKVEDILKESYRMLKKGGLLLIVDWDNINYLFSLPTEQRIKKEDILKIAKNIKFKVKEEFSAGSYHYGIVLEK